jgi:hypothetical protein
MRRGIFVLWLQPFESRYYVDKGFLRNAETCVERFSESTNTSGREMPPGSDAVFAT